MFRWYRSCSEGVATAKYIEKLELNDLYYRFVMSIPSPYKDRSFTQLSG